MLVISTSRDAKRLFQRVTKDRSSPIIVTGISGAGKTWLSSKAPWRVYFDHEISHMENGKWTINRSKLPHSRPNRKFVIETVSDLAHILIERWPQALILFVRSKPSLYREISLRKSLNESNPFAHQHAANSELSDQAIRALHDEAFQKLMTQFPRGNFLNVLNSYDKPVTYGWHQEYHQNKPLIKPQDL